MPVGAKGLPWGPPGGGAPAVSDPGHRAMNRKAPCATRRGGLVVRGPSGGSRAVAVQADEKDFGCDHTRRLPEPARQACKGQSKSEDPANLSHFARTADVTSAPWAHPGAWPKVGELHISVSGVIIRLSRKFA